MNKIKLLIDAHVFDGGFHGSRTFIKGIYNTHFFQSDKFEIYIAAHDTDNLKNNFPEVKSTNLIKYNSTSKYIRLLYELPSIINKYNIDFAHFQYIVPLIQNCKFIVTIHDVLFMDYPKEFSLHYRITKNILLKYSAKRSDILTTVSNYSKKAISKHFRIDQKNILVQPNGINSIYFEEFNKERSKDYIYQKYKCLDYILYTSRIEPRKNHIFLLNAYLELKLYQKEIHLVFIGMESILEKKFKKKLNMLEPSLKKYIHWYKQIDDSDLLEFYRGARLFVYPSKAEGFGIPPLEAAALKIDTLCSDTSAMSDFPFFEEYKFDPNDYLSFKTKLKNALENEQSPDRLDHISNFIKCNYSWEASAQKLSDLILKNL